MSKATLGLIAAASAATGAACTALYYSAAKKSETRAPSAASVAAAAAGVGAAEGPVDPSGFFQYGHPGPINDIATRDAFVSSFDRRTRNPSWVAEQITPESIKGSAKRNDKFLEDKAVPERFRARLADYNSSGYDRGHQVPAADAKFSQKAMNETFYLTNMCPQVGKDFNRDYWARLEEFCRQLVKKYPSVRVVTGPLYLPTKGDDGKYRVTYEVVGDPPNVAVPTHFYKVIVAEDGNTGGSVAVGAFVLPNAAIDKGTKLSEFLVPIPVIEKASGLEFLTKLPQNRRKELCEEIECSLTARFDRASKNMT